MTQTIPVIHPIHTNEDERGPNSEVFEFILTWDIQTESRHYNHFQDLLEDLLDDLGVVEETDIESSCTLVSPKSKSALTLNRLIKRKLRRALKSTGHPHVKFSLLTELVHEYDLEVIQFPS